MKFRKKLVVIEAVRVPLGPMDSDVRAAEWGSLLGFLPHSGDWEIVDGLAIQIRTLEGTMTASPGDWIIRGVKGELYPIRDDIFRETYEPV